MLVIARTLLALALLAACAAGAAPTLSPTASGAAAAKSQLLSALGARAVDPVLASPVTGAPLARERTVIGGRVFIAYREEGDDDVRAYRDNGNYVDLTPGSAEPMASPQELLSALAQTFSPEQFGREFFRNPYISFLYERGWRQSFDANGFPGIDREFEEVLKFIGPVADGGTVLDMSCGSGLMTRRLAGSGRFARVIGADYSESMLQETARRFREGGSPPPDLVRCDVAKLPMQTGSIDAVHAGAALHCWPDVAAGLAEIRRVLKPGGVFFATTFLTSATINAGTRNIGGSVGPGFRFFELDELRTLFEEAGFEPPIDARKEGRACAIVKAATPAADSASGVAGGAPAADASDDL